MLPVGPKPSSRMMASSAEPKKKAITATVATAIISQPESRFQIMPSLSSRHMDNRPVASG
jgi:hypothetical protein